MPYDKAVRPLLCREHENISLQLGERSIRYRPQPPDGDISGVWAFGLGPDKELGHYIGLDWIEEGSLALHVLPKISELDFQAMFISCLSSRATVQYLGLAYDIRAESPFVPCMDEAFDITPMLVLHYLTLLRDLLSKPLRKDYIAREENLRAKLKGKVLLSSHLKKNVFGQRPDRIMCRYQEFSIDCPENRLLHSAYRLSLAQLRSWREARVGAVSRVAGFEELESLFNGIGYLQGRAELRPGKSNPLYREYAEALRLARLLIRIQGYRDSSARTRERLLPPYIIDMAKLFELFVFSKLRREVGSSIHFQSKGRYGAVDFIDTDERIVIDAKYKPRYSTEYAIEDIRQVSGYARDIGILSKLGIAPEERDRVVDCLIIYPDTESPALTREHYTKGRMSIRQFHRIRKLGVAVPLKNPS